MEVLTLGSKIPPAILYEDSFEFVQNGITVSCQFRAEFKINQYGTLKVLYFEKKCRINRNLNPDFRHQST